MNGPKNDGDAPVSPSLLAPAGLVGGVERVKWFFLAGNLRG